MVEGISLHEGGEIMGVLTRCPNLFTKKKCVQTILFFSTPLWIMWVSVYRYCISACVLMQQKMCLRITYIYTYGVDIYIYVPEDLAIIYIYMFMSYIYGVYMPHSFVCTSPLPFTPRDVPSHVCPRIHGYHWLPKSFEVGAGWCQLEPIRF